MWWFTILNHSLWFICKISKNESKSQLLGLNHVLGKHCDSSARYQRMKANHNKTSAVIKSDVTVIHLQDIKEWKQITTSALKVLCKHALWFICKISKNESKSQLSSMHNIYRKYCDSSARYQRMKANHNRARSRFFCSRTVIHLQEIKDYSWNYYPYWYSWALRVWKQITTLFSLYSQHSTFYSHLSTNPIRFIWKH